MNSYSVIRASLFKFGRCCNISAKSWPTTVRHEMPSRGGALIMFRQQHDVSDGLETGQVETGQVPSENRLRRRGRNHMLRRSEVTNSVSMNEVGESNTTSAVNYRYFTDVIKKASVTSNSQTSGRQNKILLMTEDDFNKTKDLPEIASESENVILDKVTKGKALESSLKSDSSVKPALPKKSFNLAAYVSSSETLKNFVKLGVDLSKVEADAEAANHLLKLDFEKDVPPYLAFLHRSGVKDENLGLCITRNPKIFQIDLDDLEVRVNYLRSKKFTPETIERILCHSPALILMTTKELDKQLGFIQIQFSLSGDEVREVMLRYPKIALWKSNLILEVKRTITDFLGFSEVEQKQLLLGNPKVYMSNHHVLQKRFDFIHNVMGFTHQDIVAWPSVLRLRTSIIKPRYLFLKHIDRAQFDPKKEHFVSLKALASGRDLEFCVNTAKVPVQQYNDFLKTL